MAIGAETFWSLKLNDLISFAILIATIIAIYFGPIRAVEVSRRNDITRETARRRREIFAALLRTRGATLAPDHVWALNSIPLEFYSDNSVQHAYQEYIGKLSEVVPQPGPTLDAFLRRRNDLFFDLLHELAKAIGLTFDKRDLERAAYAPAGWYNEQTEQQKVRRLLIDMLEGRRAVPITVFTGLGAQSPFPPPPGAPSLPVVAPPDQAKSKQ